MRECGQVKIVARGFTTTADAYLTPQLVAYIQGFSAGFDDNFKNVQASPRVSLACHNSVVSRSVVSLSVVRGGSWWACVRGVVQVLFMQSDGGLTDVSDFSGHKAILSGPAGTAV